MRRGRRRSRRAPTAQGTADGARGRRRARAGLGAGTGRRRARWVRGSASRARGGATAGDGADGLAVPGAPWRPQRSRGGGSTGAADQQLRRRMRRRQHRGGRARLGRRRPVRAPGSALLLERADLVDAPRVASALERARRGRRPRRPSASCSPTMRAPIDSTFASLCSRASRAVTGSMPSTQRMPRILLATICSPVPLPPSTMPSSQSPAATARAAGAMTSG